MFNKIIFSILVAFVPSTIAYAQQVETRCGWIENDAPWEITLQDRDGTWIIMKDNYDAEGWIENMPDLNNGSNCGCLKVVTYLKERLVLEVHGGKLQSNKVCQQDPNL